MSGLAVKLYGAGTAQDVKLAGVRDEFCLCDFACEWREKVFHSSSSDAWKKDYTDFLFRKIGSADTVAFELYKAGYKVANLNDNTLGTYYSTFTAQPDYVGYLVDWSLVYNNFGGGTYQIKIIANILGADLTINSRYFDLNTYDEYEAHNTVKIESYQTGNIVGSEFDYTDLLEGGWYSSIRLQGMLEKQAPELITDNFLDTGYKVLQNQDKIENNYLLTLEGVPETISTRIFNKEILANSLLITDYNLFKEEIYRELELVPDRINELNNSGYGKVNMSINLKDRKQNIIKRNY